MVPWRLQPGLNLMAMPNDPRVPDLRYRMDEIGSPNVIERVIALDPDTGRLRELLSSAKNNPAFSLVGGEGLIVYATESVDERRTSLGCPSLDLRAGINLVGSLCTPEGTVASDLLDAIGGETMASSIIRFDTGTGRFESAVYDEGNLVGTDFFIDNGSGYIVYTDQI